MSDDRTDLIRKWASQQPPAEEEVTLWLSFDVDSFVSGGGATAAAAWASAMHAEVLALRDDDSGGPADGSAAFDAEVLARARRHRLVQLRLAPGDLHTFTKALGVIEDRILGLIAAAVGPGRA